MKKGISLIVLVITIIVLAILAGAIIISLSNTNVIDQASKAASAADLANAKNTLTLAYSKAITYGFEHGKTDGKPYWDVSGTTTEVSAAYYKKELEDAGYEKVGTAASDDVKWVVSIENGVPVVKAN